MGTTCDTDIDECTAGTATCTADSTCANRVNGYDCPCDRGFILNSGACAGIIYRVFLFCNHSEISVTFMNIAAGCYPLLYDCTTVVYFFKLLTNFNTYVYNCYLICMQKTTMYNLASDRYDMFVTSACTANKYGDACTANCDCVSANSANVNQMCNHVTGVCECRSQWTGSRCEIDVDECTSGTDNCAAQNKFCHNINNGFTCSCLSNQTEVNGICTDRPGM